MLGKMFAGARPVPAAPEPSDFERHIEAALKKAADRHSQVWRDRPPTERELGLRAEACFDLIAAADLDDIRDLARAVRKVLRAAGDRVPVVVQREFQVSDGTVEVGTTVWLPRGYAQQLVARGIVEPAHG